MANDVGLPLTGAGDSTATVATEQIGIAHFQKVKLFDGTTGSLNPFVIFTTTPGSTDYGLVVRNIPSGTQAVSGSVNVTSGLITLGASTAAIGAVAQGTAASSSAPWPVSGSISVSSGSITLTSGTLNIGTVGQGTAASSSAPWQIAGSVSVSSGSVLISSSTATIGTVINATSTGQIGAVALTSGTQTIGTVVQGSAGSSSVPWYVVASSAGSTANTLGSAALLAGSSANTVGSVALVAGSSANVVGSVGAFQGAVIGTSGTRIATSVDISFLSSSTARQGAMIFNESTGSPLYIGLTTAAVSSAAYTYQVAAGVGIWFGGGGFPNHTGMIRGRLQSTTLNGIAVVNSFST